MGFAALNTGNNLLYLVLSLMLSFLVLSGVLSESALRGLAVERLPPSELFAGHRTPVTLRIYNERSRLASFAVVVEDQIQTAKRPRAAGRCFVLRLGPGECVTRQYGLLPEARGELHFTGHRLSTRFPFGLFVKSLIIDAPSTRIVYPEIETVGALELPVGEASLGGETIRTRGAEITRVGVREWVPGDGLRRRGCRRSS